MNWSKSNKTSLCITLLIITVLTSCSMRNERLEQEAHHMILNQASSFKHALKEKEVLIIIPRTGCSGCIGLADYYFLEETYDTRKVQFVFTKISSLKTLRIRLGKDKIEQSHVYIDINNSFSKGALNSLYPAIVFMDAGKIMDIEFLSPDKEHLINTLMNKL